MTHHKTVGLKVIVFVSTVPTVSTGDLAIANMHFRGVPTVPTVPTSIYRNVTMGFYTLRTYAKEPQEGSGDKLKG